MTAITTTPLGSRLDTALGRLTMYRLVLWVLAVLAGYSLLLNVLGWLTFGLPEMLAHLALCLGLTYASNLALAAFFHVRPHTESSLITGLLLYFLFWPSQLTQGLQLAELAGVALACVLASASKYALAWRGRHIFNPAAAGAFLAGLTGLNIATWWAATPPMLLLVLPGALLVLYRIRKLPMAAVFTVVAVSIVAAELLQSGMELSEALWQPIAQRPVLFFVGFMLIEPLTLPPRRWQQLALAAVVGVLFAVPYNLGFVANSPELALLVGNVLAFAAGQRGRVRLQFVGRRPLTPTTTEFSFRPERPVRFTAGQYLELHLPPNRAGGKSDGKGDGKGIRRVFSLTSAPGTSLLTIGVGPRNPSRQPSARCWPSHPATGSPRPWWAATSSCPGTRRHPCCSSRPESASRPIWPTCPEPPPRPQSGRQTGPLPETGTSFCSIWQRMPQNLPMPRSCGARGRAFWPGLPTVRCRRPS